MKLSLGQIIRGAAQGKNLAKPTHGPAPTAGAVKAATQAASAPASASSPTFRERLSSMGKSIGGMAQNSSSTSGSGAGKLLKWGARAPANFTANFLGEFGVPKPIGYGIGAVGALGYLANVASSKIRDDKQTLTQALFGQDKVVPQETKKWQEKASKDIYGGLTPKGFNAQALDLAHAQSDEGWRAGIKAIDKDAFNKMAKDAVNSGDVEGLYNQVVMKAKAAGKKVNNSKPLYLPAMFSKEGKKYGYAIVTGEDGATPKLVKIELGKGVSFDQ